MNFNVSRKSLIILLLVGACLYVGSLQFMRKDIGVLKQVTNDDLETLRKISVLNNEERSYVDEFVKTESILEYVQGPAGFGYYHLNVFVNNTGYQSISNLVFQITYYDDKNSIAGKKLLYLKESKDVKIIGKQSFDVRVGRIPSTSKTYSLDVVTCQIEGLHHQHVSKTIDDF